MLKKIGVILFFIILLSKNAYAYKLPTISYDEEDIYAISADDKLYMIHGDNKTKGILMNVKTVCANYAVKQDNTLWTWGDNVFGLYDVPTQVMNDVNSVVKGWSEIYIVKTDKSLWRIRKTPDMFIKNSDGAILAENNKGEVFVPYKTTEKIMNNVEKVAVGYNHVIVLKTDGSVWTFGENYSGQLGNGMNEPISKRIKVFNEATDINAGYASSYAFMQNGDLYNWGSAMSRILYNSDGSFEEPIRHSFYPKLYTNNAEYICPRNGINIILKNNELWLYGFSEDEQACSMYNASFENLPFKIANNISAVSTEYSDENGFLYIKDNNLYRATTKTGNNNHVSWETNKLLNNVKTSIDVLNNKTIVFLDINDKVCEPCVSALSKAGIIKGKTEMEFEPNLRINRAEIATLMLRIIGKKETMEPFTSKYIDVTPDKWYYDEVGACQKYGIIEGYDDNTFRGEEDVSYLQLVVFAARTLRNEGTAVEPEEIKTINLDNIPSWAQADIEYAYNHNLITEEEVKTISDKAMTRGEAAVILYRLYEEI